MSETEEPNGSSAVDRKLCEHWMPKAQAACGRKLDHAGKHITAKALKAMVDNRPRKTTRRRGVRLSDSPDARARWRRKHKFVRLGISEEHFLKMLEEQRYACAICRTPFGDGKRIHVDHDHACCPAVPDATAKTCGRCIRGLLCVRCNTWLGWLERYGQAAEAYLARVDRAGLEPATSTV